MEIILLTCSLLFDAMLFSKYFWKFRYLIAFFAATIGLTGGMLSVYSHFNVSSTIVLLIIVFKIIAYARIFHDQLHHHRLRTVSLRSLLYLNVALILASIITPFNVHLAALEIISSLQLAVAIVMLGFIANSIHQTKYHAHDEFLSDSDLPPITVAIPARNETNDLAACVDSVLSSNYPKLEVLVLDDCTQGKKPAEIIKQHAHAGVRFLQGNPPPDDWLAKNYAYNQLVDEASGSYIVFCGVDVRMSPNYLRTLITHIKIKKKRMISILPRRHDRDTLSSFIHPMRYWRELALPRKLMNNPAVLSTCWAIDKKVLNSLGGFSAVKQSILPERYFAKGCVQHDTYAFIRADHDLDIRTTKNPISQVRTAYRVRYPQFHNRLESIFFYVLCIQIFMVLPFVLFVASFMQYMPLVQILSGLTVLLLTIAHVIVVAISQPANTYAALINFPFVALSQISISVYSMLKYEFGTVSWNGRTVCVPVMEKQKN